MSAPVPPYPARATLRLPLQEALARIWEMAQTVHPAGPPERFGREFLNLDEQALTDWFPRAWWGHFAINACMLRFLVPARHREVMSILREVDWAPLDALLQQGRGVLLPIGHAGVLHAVGCSLFQAGRPAFKITRSPTYQHPSVDVSKRSEPDFLAKLHVRALFHLRNGGIVFSGPDGGPARKVFEGKFFGRTVHLPRATAALARRSGAPSLAYIARWAGQELQVDFSQPFRPDADTPDEWETQWNDLYLSWLETQYRSHPGVALFGNGLLKELLQRNSEA